MTVRSAESSPQRIFVGKNKEREAKVTLYDAQGNARIDMVVDAFARRLQVQERLTQQIARALDEVLQPKGVGVVIEASHLCMMMRGVQKQNSKTITSALRGAFREDPKTRDEFLRLAHAG